MSLVVDIVAGAAAALVPVRGDWTAKLNEPDALAEEDDEDVTSSLLVLPCFLA